MAKALLSDVAYVRLSLDEAKGDRVKVRGEFAKCGVATANGRIYEEKIWKKEIGRLNKALKERRMFGEVDHPSDGQTKLARVSHIVTELSIKDGLVVGEAEVLPTESGKNLLALLQANVPVGVSSRGFGSVKQNEKKEDVVQDDYKLVTFDFVADPADVDAYPQVAESVQRGLFEGVEFDADDEQEKAIEFARRIEQEKTGKKVAAQASMREEFSKELLTNLAKMRAEVRDEVRAELLADPAIAGAKQALESVRDALKPYILPSDAATVVKERDEAIAKLQKENAEHLLKLKSLEEENTSLAKMAKEVGYRFYLERMLSNDPNAESIRSIVGDVTIYENSDALKAKVDAVKTELSKKQQEQQQVAESKAKEVAEAKAAEKKLRDQFEAKFAELERRLLQSDKKQEELEEQLILSRSEKKELEAKLYAEERLANHPKASKLRGLVESARTTSKADIDSIVESEREPERDADDLQEVRARIRSRMRGGREQIPQELEENVRPRSSKNEEKDYLGLGMSLDSLKRLSGIGNKQ